MTATSAHLVDKVFPEVVVRQWVLTLPIHIRYLIAYNKTVLNLIMNVFLKTIRLFLQHKLGLRKKQSHFGAVTVIQRNGSALNLNPHFHALVLDGLYHEENGG